MALRARVLINACRELATTAFVAHPAPSPARLVGVVHLTTTVPLDSIATHLIDAPLK